MRTNLASAERHSRRLRGLVWRGQPRPRVLLPGGDVRQLCQLKRANGDRNRNDGARGRAKLLVVRGYARGAVLPVLRKSAASEVGGLLHFFRLAAKAEN